MLNNVETKCGFEFSEKLQDHILNECKMRNILILTRIVLLPVFIFIAAFSAAAQKRDAVDWSITDYVKNLPKQYITASGDFLKPSKETIVVDEQNGYAVAYLNSAPRIILNDSSYPIFEMALFKSQLKPPLLVVANSINDHVCTNYETFFLRRGGGNWTEVKQEVLPPLKLEMFWDKPQSAERLLKIIEKKSISYHFEPPRRGTRMKVALEICDYVADDTPPAKAEELNKLIETAKTIYLEWDKQTGKFTLAK